MDDGNLPLESKLSSFFFLEKSLIRSDWDKYCLLSQQKMNFDPQMRLTLTNSANEVMLSGHLIIHYLNRK